MKGFVYMKKKNVSLLLCFSIILNCIFTVCAKTPPPRPRTNIDKIGKMCIIAGGTASIIFMSKIIYDYVHRHRIPHPISRPPENVAFKIVLHGGEAGEIDNVKRQFNNDKDIIQMQDILIYGTYFQSSPVFENNGTPIKFKIFTTPSILLPNSEPRECRMNYIKNSHRNIIFFDAENLNIPLIFQYVNLCRETQDPYIILVPIINPNFQSTCYNNISQIKSLFSEIKMSDNFITKSNRCSQIVCGDFNQESVDAVRSEVLNLGLFF